MNNCRRKKISYLNGEIVYPCSFPDCDKYFSSENKRGYHHKEHLDERMKKALENNEKVYCPYCGTYFTYLLVLIQKRNPLQPLNL